MVLVCPKGIKQNSIFFHLAINLKLTSILQVMLCNTSSVIISKHDCLNIGLLYGLVIDILNYQVKLACNSLRSILHNLNCKFKYFYSFFFILMSNKVAVTIYVVLGNFYILGSYVLKKTNINTIQNQINN